MSESKAFLYRRAVVGFMTLLLLFLVFADYLILSYQRALLTMEATGHAQHELELIGTLSREALLAHDYITVRNFLTQFAAEQKEIRVIRAVNPDHFVLAEYLDQRPSKFPLRTSHEVLSQGHPLVLLEMEKDLSFIDETLNQLTLRLIAVSVLLTAALGASLWSILRTRAMIPLEREIAERRQAEEAARLNAARFRQLSAATFEGIAVIEEGRVIDGNRQMAEMLGWEPGELIGRPVTDFVAPQSRELVLRNVQAGFEGVYEHFLLRKDGSHLACEARARMMTWQGKKTRVTALRDISERKQAEAALRDNELRLRAISNNLIFGMIYQVLRLHDGSRRFTYLSDSVRRYYGISPEQGLADAKLIYGRVHEDDRERVRQLEEEANRSLSPFKMEVRMVNPSGAIRWSYFVSTPTRLADGATCWDGIEFDISERKEAEAQLSRGHKMEAMGTLAAGIAHDFNNILHIMTANLELAGREPASPPLCQALAVLGQCGERAKGLVQQILRFSRQSQEERGPVALPLLVREAAALFAADSRFATVTVETRLDEGLTPILANAEELRQLVTNLLVNAGQALGESGGRITVTLMGEDHASPLPTYDDRLAPGRYQRLTVHDNGCGMDEATLARLFEPFFTTRGQAGGTGLGLAIIHGIVRSLGGGITVSSEPGVGTTFVLYFPVAAAGDMPVISASGGLLTTSPAPLTPTAAAGTAPLPSPSGINILFVDDEQLNVNNWGAILTMEGFTVQGCTSGVEAQAAFSKAPMAFSLLLTDLRMPGMSGSELALALRRIRPDIPVIFSSGWVDKETEALIKEFTGSALLCKPYQIESLVNTILTLCQTRPGNPQ